MATTINKQRLLTALLSVGRKLPPVSDEAQGERPVLQQFIFGLCREDATAEQAEQAYRTLCDRFFDWNEVRVSSIRELEEVFAGMTNAEGRAQRLVAFLQEVFETTFSFDLDSLQKKGLKQAAKQLARYQAANDYVSSWVVQRSLGGHAIPLDAPTLRCSRRLGLIESDDADREAARASLEHLVPKAKGPQFTDLISTLAGEHCWEDEPNCPSCPLAHDCPTGHATTGYTNGTSRTARPKPR
jgi:endonuclease III